MTGSKNEKSPAKAGLFRLLEAPGSVAHLLLHVLPALLRIDRALGGEARFEALQADFLAGVDAVTVVARINTLERAVDFADQLSVTIAGTQLQRVLGLAGGALCFVTD